MRKPVILTLVVVVLLGAIGLGGWTAYQYLVKRYTPQACTVKTSADATTRLSAEQARNASIIVAIAVERGLPERAAVVALATAYQESALRNIDHGDRDSVGLFQQRPSQGWGTITEIMDPWYSAGKFYDGLVKVKGWESMSVTEAAQAVQISAYPDAYAKHETNATALAKALMGSEHETLWCINFETDPTVNTDAFKEVLAALGSVTISEMSNTQMKITARDETSLWAAANHVVANSYNAGATEVTVEGRRWRAPDQGWTAAQEQAGKLNATITFG